MIFFVIFITARGESIGGNIGAFVFFLFFGILYLLDRRKKRREFNEKINEINNLIADLNTQKENLLKKVKHED